MFRQKMVYLNINTLLVMKNLFTAFVFSFGLILCLQAQNAGNALHFDGTNDYVSAPLPPVFNNIPTNSFTIEAWVYPQGSSFSRIVFAQQNTSNFVSFGVSISNTVYFYVVSSGTTYSIVTTNALPINQWTHVAARWIPGSNTTEVLFNGVLQAAVAGGTSSTGTSSVMTIGARSDGTTQFFTGMLDELKIWNSARTNCQIAGNMNSTLLGTEPGLSAYYKFNQGNAGANNAGITNLPDLSSGGSNGTLQNFGLNGMQSNWLASGAVISQTGLSPGFTSSQTVSLCSGSDYTFPDGSTETNITSGLVHVSNLISVASCDSLVTTTVNLLPVYNTSENVSVCNGSDYTFPDGSTQTGITSTVVHVSNLSSVLLCDSNITTTVNVKPVYNLDETYGVCFGSDFTFPDGSTQTNISATSIHVSHFSSLDLCDSIITTTLNITEVDTSVAQVGLTLYSGASGADYQWINCDGNIPVSGATGQSFTPDVNGSYAVIVTKNGCPDTSSCYSIVTFGLQDENNTGISIFPNPNTGTFWLNTGAWNGETDIRILDLTGKTLASFKQTGNSVLELNIEQPAGMYLVSVNLGDGRKQVFRVVKN